MDCGEHRRSSSSDRSCVPGSSLAVCAFRFSDKCSQLFSETLTANCCLETYRRYHRTDHSRPGGFRRGFLVCLWSTIWSRILARAPWLHSHVCWHFSQLIFPFNSFMLFAKKPVTSDATDANTSFWLLKLEFDLPERHILSRQGTPHISGVIEGSYEDHQAWTGPNAL